MTVQEETAQSAKTLRAAVESRHPHYQSEGDFTAQAVIDSMHRAQWQLRNAGSWLVRGDVPACVGAIEASRRALGAALDSLAALSWNP